MRVFFTVLAVVATVLLAVIAIELYPIAHIAARVDAVGGIPALPTREQIYQQSLDLDRFTRDLAWQTQHPGQMPPSPQSADRAAQPTAPSRPRNTR